MSLSPAFLDELRARTTLSALVGKSVKLQRAGREQRACCPFHNEKSPSFYVNDDKGFYHCFGCGAHGDAIRWLTEHQGLPFIDAVKELAAAAGLDMPAQDPRATRQAERARGLIDLCEDAARWFAEQLHGPNGGEARAACHARGLDDATIRDFGLGLAPDSRGRLRAALAEYGDAMLVEAGLLIAVEGKEPYDRFRGRLMIPIRDPRGRAIAFGGRILDGPSGSDGGTTPGPKYLNSPETPLFDKGRQLYNLDRAAAPSRKVGRIIVVEGYMDTIALAQAGIAEVVAPLGTALTEAQLERLWRQAEVPILCFDGDSAGQKAAMRAAERALPMLAPGRSLSFVTLPEGQDPDDCVRAGGAAAFERFLARPQPLSDRIWQAELAAGPLDTPEQRAGLKQRLADRVAAIADRSVAQEYQAEFRARFDERFGRGQRAAFRPRAPAIRGGGRRGTPWKPPDPPASAAARGIGAGGIDASLLRAVLAGLIRHPAEIPRHVEALGMLRSGGSALGRLFDAVVEVALEDQALDSAGLVTILARSGFDQIAGDLLRTDTLPFSFTQAGQDPDTAAADLNEAIAVMVARPRVDAALAAATAAMQADFTEAAFARQVSLVQERQALDARLANLVLADKDGKTFA